MRDYARVLCLFWNDGSGKALRSDDDARLLAMYLFTFEHGNMVGLARVALPTMLHELGTQWTESRFRSVMTRLSEHDVAHYDYDAELLYLPAGARTQIGKRLAPKDRKRGTVEKILERHAGHRFAALFRAKYAADYGLDPPYAKTIQEGASGIVKAPLQKQKQKQKQKQDHSARELEPDGRDPKLAELAEHIEANPEVGDLVDDPYRQAERWARGFDMMRPEWLDAAKDAVTTVAESRSANELPHKTLERVSYALKLRRQWVNDRSWARRRREQQAAATGQPLTPQTAEEDLLTLDDVSGLFAQRPT